MLGRIDRQMLAAGPEACYDANAKMLLSEKIILAHILAGCVEEFADMDPQVILEYIDPKWVVRYKVITNTREQEDRKEHRLNFFRW